MIVRLIIALVSFFPLTCLAQNDEKPNLIMIIVDEHNLRTLGSYRRLMKEEAFAWGKDVVVETPYIDSIANDGAIYKNFYTVTPLCTPSRASFMSGLYPQETGPSYENHGAMSDDIETFAQTLLDKRGYYTGYFGKWHLNGMDKPGFNNRERKFGFIETKFQYNRGHWKFFERSSQGVDAYEWEEGLRRFNKVQKKHYSTDFMFDRGIEFITRQMNKEGTKKKPFAMVISIADPHAPNEVRQPYTGMYDNMNFLLPKTATAAVTGDPAVPRWTAKDSIIHEGAEEFLQEYENSEFWQNHLSLYFGMVKCIDANVGKLLKILSDYDIDKNTILVFTADHGDQLGEHGRLNKGTPYEMSAGVPFLLRYPNKVKAGKVIETAYSSIDFAPTILNLMGVKNLTANYNGIDGSGELLSEDMSPSTDQIRFSFDTGKKNRWAAAIMNGFKLVVSKTEIPWFFNLNEDPDEMYNVFDDPKYKETIAKMKQALLDETSTFRDTFFRIDSIIHWDTPACRDSSDVIPTTGGGFCSQLGSKEVGYKYSMERCSSDIVKTHCPVTCEDCCEDSKGFLYSRNKLMACDELAQSYCHIKKVKEFCPMSCGTC